MTTSTFLASQSQKPVLPRSATAGLMSNDEATHVIRHDIRKGHAPVFAVADRPFDREMQCGHRQRFCAVRLRRRATVPGAQLGEIIADARPPYAPPPACR